MDWVQRIISWNINHINGILGNKTDDPDFVGIISPHDIICLQETGNEVQLSGFKSFSDTRKGRRGGGVTTLIREHLVNHCKNVIRTKHDDCSINTVILKIRDDTTGHNTFVVNCYIPPANSIRKGTNNNPTANFDFLHDILNNIREDPVNDEIIICGDLNARIGVSPDFQEQYGKIDSFIFGGNEGAIEPLSIPEDSPISAHRNNSDKGVNSHKKLLLDLVESQNMLILNGRTLGDSTGKFTCFKWNGNSVVDYFIATSNFLHRVKSLTVSDYTLYSDHNPVVLCLNRGRIPVKKPNKNSTYEEAPRRYLITPESLISFKNALNDDETAECIHSINTKADEITSDRHSVECLYSEISSLINKVASKSFDISKPVTNKKPGYSVWFDDTCHAAKRLMKRSAKIVNKFPDKVTIKERHRANVKSYRRTIISKRDKFLDKLNRKIKDGKTISWKDFKKLKKYSKSDPNIDTDYLDSFKEFYSNLYSDEHPTVDQLTKEALIHDAELLVNSNSEEPSQILNSPFTLDELDASIKSLKSGKASSFDMISNEIIKALNQSMRQLLLRLFNICLSSGIYLWARSVITPLHKKGSVSDPDNYRAIAVCSCLGKLLSTMLLNRLISHRSANYPDPPNQAGFTKGSQCNDHIFALLSLAEKYKKVKGKIYAVFIDLRKAFDLVCRQALLFKLACYGVNGGFYKLIKNMYQNSSGQIKLNGKLSKAFKILKGTEQGHPLSPELFKVYFKELSDVLNEAAVNINCPTLSGLTISHLAWADDLVILALDQDSLQALLDIVAKYCRDWGLEINTSKTKFLIVNGKVPVNGWRPTLNSSPIELVTSYCYLGVIISSNGSFKQAVDTLHKKGLGSYFALRNTVDRRFVNARTLDKLFDSLVSPILTYGCQIWLPTHATTKMMLRDPLQSFLPNRST